MKTNELKKFVESDSIRKIIFFLPGTIYDLNRPYVWEVWVYGYEDEKVIDSFGNCLKTLSGQSKTYTSLDRARAAMRELGYTGSFTIDG